MEEMQPTFNLNIPPEIQVKPTKPWLKIALSAGLGLILISSLVFVGFQMQKRQEQTLSQLTSTPSPTIIPTQPMPLTPTLGPTSILAPEQTTDWKTYTNNALRFELKYPNIWTTKPFSISTTYPVYAVVELASDIKTEDMKWPSIQIHYWDNPENLTLAQLEQKYTSTESGLGPKIYQPGGEWIKVGGVDAYRVRQGDCEPYGCDKITISYKQRVFVLQNYLVIPEDTYNQILLTFKFLE